MKEEKNQSGLNNDTAAERNGFTEGVYARPAEELEAGRALFEQALAGEGGYLDSGENTGVDGFAGYKGAGAGKGTVAGGFAGYGAGAADDFAGYDGAAKGEVNGFAGYEGAAVGLRNPGGAAPGADADADADADTDMDTDDDSGEGDEERRRRRKEARGRQQKERQKRLFLQYGIAGAVLVAAVVLVIALVLRGKKQEPDPRAIATENRKPGLLEGTGQQPPEQESAPTQEAVPVWSYEAHLTEDTAGFAESVVSETGVLIDVESGEILAEKGAYDRISPASMTKILTALVAAEQITPEQLDDTFTMTIEITDYSYKNGCSNAGFEVGEKVTVRDLFYGTILPSGADAAVGLATYVAGSHEAFVELMNEKLEELGLSETTHFTNCVGLYDEDHYSTVYDMAVILKAATDNEWCREVMSARKYTTSVTGKHKEGMVISNWFLRRIEDKDTHGEVLCAKTGFVNQSGSCAASLASDHSGKEYICVTAGSTSSWRCIYDHVDIYTQYLPEG